jgi:hypothetical protein
MSLALFSPRSFFNTKKCINFQAQIYPGTVMRDVTRQGILDIAKLE